MKENIYTRKIEVGDLWKIRGDSNVPDQYFLVLQVFIEDGIYCGTVSMKVDCGTICNVMVNGDPTIWTKEA